MKNISKLIALALCLILVMGFTATAMAESPEKTVTLAAQTAWTTINMFMSMDGNTNFIHGLIWEPLFLYNMNGDIVPMVAESYEVNDDMTEYTIHIRQNAYFSDGEQLTADDVMFTFQLNMDPTLATTRHSYLK